MLRMGLKIQVERQRDKIVESYDLDEMKWEGGGSQEKRNT